MTFKVNSGTPDLF